MAQSNKKENKMETMSVPKLVMSMSLPLMISLLIQSLYNIVDGIYVARISEKALAATSLAYPIQMLMIAVSVGTGVGINSLLSRKIGAREFDQVNLTASTGLLLSVLSSVVFAVVGDCFSVLFFENYTDDVDLILWGTQYLQICTTFSIGIFVATMGERILQATGNTMHSMIAQTAGAITNVVLDPIFIFGFMGIPAMGVRGAAVATVIGQWVAAILSILLVYRRNEVRFVIKGFRLEASLVRDIYVVGCPSMFVQAMSSFMMMGVNHVLLEFSATAVSFFGIYYKLQNFAFMPVSGVGQGLIPIVGFNYGAKHGRRITDSIKVASILGIAIMAVAMVLFLAIPRQLLMLYHATDAMLEIGIPGLRILSVVFVPTAVVLIVGYTFTGLGNGMVNMIGTILRMILPIPMVYVSARMFSLGAVWHSFWISAIIAMIYCLVILKRAYTRQIEPMVFVQE